MNIRCVYVFALLALVSNVFADDALDKLYLETYQTENAPTTVVAFDGYGPDDAILSQKRLLQLSVAARMEEILQSDTERTEDRNIRSRIFVLFPLEDRGMNQISNGLRKWAETQKPAGRIHVENVDYAVKHQGRANHVRMLTGFTAPSIDNPVMDIRRVFFEVFGGERASFLAAFQFLAEMERPSLQPEHLQPVLGLHAGFNPADTSDGYIAADRAADLLSRYPALLRSGRVHVRLDYLTAGDTTPFSDTDLSEPVSLDKFQRHERASWLHNIHEMVSENAYAGLLEEAERIERAALEAPREAAKIYAESRQQVIADLALAQDSQSKSSHWWRPITRDTEQAKKTDVDLLARVASTLKQCSELLLQERSREQFRIRARR